MRESSKTRMSEKRTHIWEYGCTENRTCTIFGHVRFPDIRGTGPSPAMRSRLGATPLACVAMTHADGRQHETPDRPDPRTKNPHPHTATTTTQAISTIYAQRQSQLSFVCAYTVNDRGGGFVLADPENPSARSLARDNLSLPPLV